MTTATLPTLRLKFAGHARDITVPDGVDELPIPWPDPHAPADLLRVRVHRDQDGRAYRLSVKAFDNRVQWAQGEGGTAIRMPDGTWWTVGAVTRTADATDGKVGQ